MDRIERLLSRPTAKPYRSKAVEASENPFLNKDGHVDFAPDDIENPKNWSKARRWYITIVAVSMVVNATIASSSPSGALDGIAESLGTIDRGNAIALFSIMTYIGPALGPVISGFLELKENWRWNFYVLLWLAGITELLMFTLPETLPSMVLLNKARRIRRLNIPGFENVKAPVEATDRSLAGIFKVALTRPWKILVDPISLMVAIYLSVVYTLLYMLFTIYPIVFQQKRGWNSGVGELPLVGTIVGAVIGGILIFANSARDKKKMLAGYQGRAEDRLPVAMLGGILFPITMFWFAWTAEYNSIHWIVPTIAGVFLATSILLIFVAYLNYLTDTYLMFAASAIAANTICRSAAGASAPLFTQYMFDALGVGGGGSLIGGVAILLAPIPFIFYKYGELIRVRSKFAPTPDKSAEQNEVPREQEPRHTESIINAESGGESEESCDNTYNEEGVGVDRVAKSSDEKEVDVVQPREPRTDFEKDLEKGEP
ncbi:hypothetical protein G7Y89_g4964 [Cudoniella acicularis]|uniref:Major facilitator superfamily (MFS) profile domain-containing protein n=1 Tax=Cudoniella acicularis TaxID=354080 RepID=A0A8H4W3T8_9HELO|nr:hypothetical protein G7Y89_g4964 [Cudoniella acicularis]